LNGLLLGPQDGLYSFEPYDPMLTGYMASTDIGSLMTFKIGSPGGTPAPGQYYPVDLPGSVGGTDYRENIAHCNPEIVKVGDWLWAEGTNMVGPTRQGVDDLMSQDPDAYWDASCNCVRSPVFGDNQSPRLVVIPSHDPRITLAPGKIEVHVVKLIGMFLEGQNKGLAIIGRFTTEMVPGEPGSSGGPGYLYTCPVPTQPTRWGHVKAIYR
jgi:hypothetical protein